MAVKRMHHVGVVVEDFEPARDFFVGIGLVLEDEWMSEGGWVDRVIDLPGSRSRCAMLATPDGHARIELSRFETPVGAPAVPDAAVNAAGLRHLAFPVDDLEATLAVVRGLGYEVLGTVERYEDVYLLAFVRGPEGLIIELAEEL